MYENKKYRCGGNVSGSRKKKKDAIYLLRRSFIFYEKRNDYVERGAIPVEFYSQMKII
jgi:hypothetical protein